MYRVVVTDTYNDSGGGGKTIRQCRCAVDRTQQLRRTGQLFRVCTHVMGCTGNLRIAGVSYARGPCVLLRMACVSVDIWTHPLRCFHEANGRNDRDGVRLNRFAGQGKA